MFWVQFYGSDGRNMGARWIITGSIKNGDTAAFADIAERMSKLVRDQEPDAITYDWFASEDGSTFVLEEHYKDDAAFNLHMKNIAALMPDFLAVAKIEKIIILGKISKEAGDMLAGMGSVVAHVVTSLNR